MRQMILPYILVAAAMAAQAQTTSPLSFRIQQGSNAATLSDGGTFTIQAEAIGQPALAQLTVTNRGTSTITVGNLDQTGALDFELNGLPEFPVTLGPNQGFNVNIRYVPRTSNRLTGRIGFVYTEGRGNLNVGVNLIGISPEFAFSAIPQGGNAVLLTQGATVSFPTTAIDATSNMAVVVINRGTAPGTVKSQSISGSPAFQLTGLPLADMVVEAGRELRFNVAFTPRQLDAVTAAVGIELVGSRFTFNVAGAGSGAVYSYDLIRDGAASPLPPTSLITVPDVAVNEKSTAVVRFRNNGNAEGRVTQINVQGTGFSLSDVPFLPLVLQPGQTSSVTVQFAPTAAGRVNGRLRIGDDTFELTSNGLGSILNYAYLLGPVSTTVASGGTVNFTPAQVGRSSTLRFQINNTGTLPAPISNVSITGGNNVFTLADIPPLPAEVPANGSISFAVNFTPVNLTAATATLRIDSQSFTLSGTGTNPAPIPSYTIDGAAATQEPLQQPGVGVTLASAYPLRLNGTLNLTLNSGSFANDPAVQFATGGRTINFTIPAGQTRAVFPDGSNQVRLQTGSVAGTITLTPSFATEGGVDLTPQNPASMNLTVAQSAPRILNVTVTGRTASGFTLVITGLATSRTVNQLDLTFSPVSGENLQTTRLSLSVASSFLAWYQSQASQPFGSLFTLTVPLTLSGDVRTQNLSLVDTIQSVSITLRNAQGTSAARNVDLK